MICFILTAQNIGIPIASNEVASFFFLFLFFSFSLWQNLSDEHQNICLCALQEQANRFSASISKPLKGLLNTIIYHEWT